MRLGNLGKRCIGNSGTNCCSGTHVIALVYVCVFIYYFSVLF